MSAPAQTSRAQVQGLVIDASGAAVPNATVTLSNVNTGVKTVRQTSNTGLYVFDLVSPGIYTVTVQAAGFPPFTQPNFQVQSGGDVTINAQLNTGILQQTITVNAEGQAVEFNNASNNLTIDTKMANDPFRYHDGGIGGGRRSGGKQQLQRRDITLAGARRRA